MIIKAFDLGDINEAWADLQLLMWTLFQQLGCACNPVRALGTPEHQCPLVLPWTYRTTDLMSFLSDLLTLPALQRITRHLMARNFSAFWLDADLMRVLRIHCIVCGEIPDRLEHFHSCAGLY